MASPRTRSKAGARKGDQAGTSRSQVSPAQYSEDGPSSRSPRADAAGEHVRGQPSNLRGPLAETTEQRSPERSPTPRRDDAPRDGPTSTAGQTSALAPPGIRGPSDALAIVEVLLQFPPVPMEDMPRMTAWVARLKGLVGYAQNQEEPI